MKEASTFGRNYWCVKISNTVYERVDEEDAKVTDPTEIYLYADTCEVLPSGALEFRYSGVDRQTGKVSSVLNMAFAPGNWICVYAADIEDGTALAVET